MTFRKYLTVLLVVILMFAASAAGIFTAQKLTSQMDSDFSVNVYRELEEPAPKEEYNVLLMGTDAEGGLTDVMMVYHIDPKQKRIKVLSIPRDTRILYNNRTEKINAAHAYGKKQQTSDGHDRADEYAIRAVKELTGIPIHHYACINFAAFRQVIDVLGGFDYDVPQRMKYSDPWQDLYIDLQPGMQHLDGDKAEQLVRFRRYTDGDIDRVAVQQDVLKELIKQKVNPTGLAKVPEIYETVLSNVDTDMTLAEAVGIAKNVLDASASKPDGEAEDGGEAESEEAVGIETFTLPGAFRDIRGISYWEPSAKEIETLVAEEFGYGSAEALAAAAEKNALTPDNAKVSTNKPSSKSSSDE